MSLKVGDKAPDFTLKSKNVTGEVKDISLSDYKGKNVVLLFFSQAFTGACKDEMCQVTNGVDEFANLNAEVLGISVDSVFTQEAWTKSEGIGVPLLSDFNREVIKLYGTEFPEGEFVFGMNGVSRRAAFVIDKDGVIQYIDITDDISKLPDFDGVKQAVDSLS